MNLPVSSHETATNHDTSTVSLSAPDRPEQQVNGSASTENLNPSLAVKTGQPVVEAEGEVDQHKTDANLSISLPELSVLNVKHTEVQRGQMEFDATRSADGALSFVGTPVNLEYTAGNFKWQVQFAKSNRSNKLILTWKFVTATAANHWRVPATLTFSFSRKEGEGTLKKETSIQHVFESTASSICRRIRDVFWRPVVALPVDGEPTVKSVVNVEVTLKLREVYGFRCRRLVSYDFTQRSQESDIVFKFGEDSVYFSCAYLSFHSPYFAAMKRRLVHMKHDENGLPFEEMDGGSEGFIQLLHLVYPCRWNITDKIVSTILPLADRFLLDGVLKDCEHFLMSNSSSVDIFLKLHWSSLYSMNDLQDWCLSQLRTTEAIVKVRTSDVYSQLSLKVMTSLFEKVTDLEAQRRIQASIPAPRTPEFTFGRL